MKRFLCLTIAAVIVSTSFYWLSLPRASAQSPTKGSPAADQTASEYQAAQLQRNDQLLQTYSNQTRRADEVLRGQEDRTRRVETLLVRQEQLMDKQEAAFARFQKILDTWEQQQKQYQQYLDSLKK